MAKWVRILTYVVVMVLGFVAGTFLGSGVHTSQHRTLIALEMRSLAACADALRSLESNEPAAASRVLEERLRSSIADLDHLTQVEVRLDSPDLGASARRAEEYARLHGLTLAAEQARRVSERLGVPR